MGPLPPPRVFFVSAHSKGVAGGIRVSADSARLKVAVFSMSCVQSVSADSKGVTQAFGILISILFGTAHSKGVRRTAWRASMAGRARRDRADLTKPL